MGKKTKSNRLNWLMVIWVVHIFLSFNATAFSGIPLLPSSIIKLPENENVILVEKKTQTLFLYTVKDKTLFARFQAPCSTGKESGVKQKAGDRKTPEGIYFLYDEYEDKYLSPIYGTKAFPIDYPNFMDKKADKNGSAIWIHGTNKKLKPMDSNGCIAMENYSIQKLSDYINLYSTPVIIVEEIDEIDGKTLAKQEKAISLFLHEWLKAIEKGSCHDYLSFYSSEYLPDITWWEQWHKIRKTANKAGSNLKVKNERTGIYFHNNIFVVLFDYFLTSENKKILLGQRKLFLENKDSNYKIVGDTFQAVNIPLVVAAKTLVKPILKK